MKRVLMLLVLGISLGLVGGQAIAAEKTEMCKWSDEASMQMHLEKHVIYPSTGAAVKEACKKEAPGEFSETERTCFESKISDKTEYKNAMQVMAALGMKTKK